MRCSIPVCNRSQAYFFVKNNTMILGLIPARGGSKGVPGKNIRRVGEKPLINYAIECGLACPSIDRVVVSTDSEKIAKIAQAAGAQVPFLRPKELAQDDTPMLPVLQHAIEKIEKISKIRVNLLVLLDPTGPLRTVADVEAAIRLIQVHGCDAVISGHTAHRNPYFNMVVPDGVYVRIVLKADPPIGRRQDAPKIYDLNTVVWIYTRSAVMERDERIPKRTMLYHVPIERSIDLDSERDFEYLELLMRRDESF